jgi:spore germination protein YaaH
VRRFVLITALIPILAAYAALAVAAAPPAAAAATTYKVAAWTFGDRASLTQAADRHALDQVDVDWYISNKNGTLGAVDQNLAYVRLARSRRLTVFATVANWNTAKGRFDRSIAQAILAGPVTRARHIDRLVNLCKVNGYNGIDLDWEALRAADRDRFSTFVETLAQRLHAAGKLLSIAVYPKTSEPGQWQGQRSEDWLRIGKAVDQFKIMTYDFSGPWSRPGPVAPPSWTSHVLDFAQTIVPLQKIWMGVPFYGYDWGGGHCASLTWTGAHDLIARYHPQVHHAASHEARFHYRAGGHRHEVYFQDRVALAAKLSMMLRKHPRIAGIAIWRMGGEPAMFWDQIAAQLK